jgi:murein L,D-transpeptidase YcbB/YkuD
MALPLRGVLFAALAVVLALPAGPAAANAVREAAADALHREADGAQLWLTPAGKPTARGRLVLDTLRRAADEGLRSRDYGVPDDAAPTPTDPRAADRRITVALLKYIVDVRDGRLAPKQVDPVLFIFERKTDAAAILRQGLQAKDFGQWLAALPPDSERYRRLKRALARYRALGRAAWPALSGDGKLERGMAGPAVAALRHRLAVLGDLHPATADDTAFDDSLHDGVMRFQARHGLEADGVVGPRTRTALNVSPAARALQIEMTMERLRWLPDTLGERHIVVNIAGFELTAFENGAEVLRMPVIVGRDQRRTPVLTDHIPDVIFRPRWTVPPRLAKNDLLPKIKKDPAYLQTMGFRVFRSWQAGAAEVDTKTIDWQSISAKSLGFKFRQDSGSKNALGLIRFSLTNPLDIYLHDTPDRNLFAKPGRAFSSGCIRVSDPVALARFVLASQPEWTEDAIRAAMNGDRTFSVKVAGKTPVHVIYATAWVDGGRVEFRDDVYGRDKVLNRALGLSTH